MNHEPECPQSETYQNKSALDRWAYESSRGVGALDCKCLFIQYGLGRAEKIAQDILDRWEDEMSSDAREWVEDIIKAIHKGGTNDIS